MFENRIRSEKAAARKIRAVFLSFIAASFVFGGGALRSFAQTDDARIKAAAVTPESLSASFAEVSKRAENAVVNIDTKGKMPTDINVKGESDSKTPDDIAEFYRRLAPRRPSYAVGSGFLVDKAGYIITNFHVVNDASRITVKLQSGEEFQAVVVGTDELTDLAILKIDANRDLPFLKLGNSDQARIGDWVLAIGSPFGLEQTVTAGIISQTKRETPFASQFQKFIQTDAAINRGNSGGPLVDMNGEVIGVNSQIATLTGDYNGIGFALPSNAAANVYQQIRQGGKVRRGFLGVTLDSVKSEFAKVYNLDEAKGAIITGIPDKQNSSAAAAGLQAGDIILELNGERILNAADLITRVAATTPTKEINLAYLRETGTNLERRSATIKLGERPSRDTVSSDENQPKKLPISDIRKPVLPFGLTLIEITPQLAALYKLGGATKGLVIKSVDPASFIADVKNASGNDALNPGDLIQRINRTSVTDLKTFNDLVAKLKKGDAVVLQVQSYDSSSQNVLFRIVQFTVQ